MQSIQVIYETKADAVKRYSNQVPQIETVSKPYEVKLTTGATAWAVNVNIWSLD